MKNKDIIDDVWIIMREVYKINENVVRSQKQEEFLTKLATYILSRDNKDTECLNN